MLDVDKHRNERYGFPQTKKEEKHMFLHEIYSSTLRQPGPPNCSRVTVYWTPVNQCHELPDK